jgi:membrane protein DedA with SNARE-associated domain
MRFTLWDAAGEAIWVGFYVLMGYQFSTGITELASLLSDAAGFVVAAAAAIVLGFVLVRRLREHPRE